MSKDEQMIGTVSWDDLANDIAEKEQNQTENKGAKGLPFLNMKFPGEYVMRIVDLYPTPYYCHWIDGYSTDVNGNKTKGRKKVNCSQDSECPVCTNSTGKGPEQKFYIKVLSRTTGTLKILDFGYQIAGGISGLVRNDKWGDTREYDIVITKKAKGANPLYVVAPNPKEALTDDELAMIEESNMEGSDTYADFKKLQAPWSPQKINTILTGKDPEQETSTKEEETDTTKEVEAEVIDENLDFGDEEFMEVEE